ncbi:MAG: hypothetical protein HY905_16510 [Deltaproteobacteria bacterium]|nr:hypothetical protein [Deltaproteobacteria bacterium]
MRLRLTFATMAVALGLAGCMVTPGRFAVRTGAAGVYVEPYTVYRSGEPYVFFDGTYWDYPDYYRHYYGPAYVAPPAPVAGARLVPPPPVIVTGHGAGPEQHHAHRYGHHGHD